MDNVNISLSKDNATYMASVIKKDLVAVTEKFLEYKRKKEELEILLDQLEGKAKKVPHDAEGYSNDFTWLKKIKYALGKNGPSTTPEIFNVLAEIEPDLTDNRRTAIRSISATISTILNDDTGNPIFIKSTNNSGEYVYELNYKNVNNME